MKVQQYGSNQTVISWTVDSQPVELFFSYTTVVAGKVGDTVFKTDEFHSVTTSKHINNYLRSEWAVEDVKKVPQVDQNILNQVGNVNSDPSKAFVILANNLKAVA